MSVTAEDVTWARPFPLWRIARIGLLVVLVGVQFYDIRQREKRHARFIKLSQESEARIAKMNAERCASEARIEEMLKSVGVASSPAPGCP